MFQAMTGGVDWGDPEGELRKSISPVMTLLFCCYVAFTQLALLNVITGVFVESALESNAEEKDANMVARLIDFLENGDNPGTISLAEFESRLDDPILRLYFKSVDLDPAEARGLF